MNKKNILIAGAGNPWRSDDGTGITVIERLHALQHAGASYLAKNQVDILDVGTDGLALLDILPNYQKAIIIDAVEMNAAPATIKVFFPEEAKIKITSDALSTHGFGLGEMLKLAEQLHIPTQIIIIGVQPYDLSFGNELSAEVKNKIDDLLKAVKHSIDS